MALSKGDIAAPFIQVKEDENGVLQDILFKSHIHPKRKLATLGDAELGRMYSSVNRP